MQLSFQHADNVKPVYIYTFYTASAAAPGTETGFASLRVHRIEWCGEYRDKHPSISSYEYIAQLLSGFRNRSRAAATSAVQNQRPAAPPPPLEPFVGVFEVPPDDEELLLEEEELLDVVLEPEEDELLELDEELLELDEEELDELELLDEELELDDELEEELELEDEPTYSSAPIS